MKERRNYRMFKKRVAEMDIYQEYRRSHDRVKVMLKDEVDVIISSESDTPISAQENLRNFIKQHEARLLIPESDSPPTPTEEELDQAFIDLKQDTILNPVLPETQSNSYQNTYQDTFTFQKPKYDYEYSLKKNLSPPNNFAFDEKFNPPNHNEEDKSTNYEEQQEQIFPFKSVKVEEELETIIREALTNFNPASSIQSSDIDPELLKMIKEFIFTTTTTPDSFSNSFFSTAPFEQQNVIQFEKQLGLPENQFEGISNTASLTQKELKGNDAAILEKQIQDQQVPPKIPSTKTTVRRPSIPEPMSPLETTFSAADYEDDSSLALTKNELKMQVRNLIRESLAESDTEIPSKPNDLLQLEKQLKEHIEKLKQSRKAL